MYPERMLRPALFVAVLLASAGASAQPAGAASTDGHESSQSPHGLCGQVPAIAEELTQISGMKMRHAVPCDFITKEKIKEFLNKRIKEETKPEEIRAEELTLKKFGLLPPDF